MIDKAFHKSCADSLTLLAKKILSNRLPENNEATIPGSVFLKEYPELLLKEIGTWSNKDRVIYIFKISSPKSPSDLLRKFTDAKNNEKSSSDPKKRKAFAKINSASETLYVGSSRNLNSRLRQHFGYKDKTTYSMQLKHWIDKECIENISINVWKYKSIDQHVLQAIENHLWDTLKPMLGKRGGK